MRFWILSLLTLAFTIAASAQVTSLVSRALFDQMLKHRNDAGCAARGFYTYDAFVAAANSFGGFARTGDTKARKREIAAFLAQTSHETTGGWPTAPDGPYSYNYNYGPAGRAIGANLLGNPDLVATVVTKFVYGKYSAGVMFGTKSTEYFVTMVATDPTVSFRTAFWFWMTPQSPKPSCHDVITGRWQPSSADRAAGRLPGFGVITNIINGGLECGREPDAWVADHIGFYKRYCDILRVGYGPNLFCYNQSPYIS